MRRFLVRVQVGELRPGSSTIRAFFLASKHISHTWRVFPPTLADFIPQWFSGIFAAVPNIALGVAILIFRKRILALVKQIVPTMSEDAVFWVSRVILVGGLFLIVLAGFLLFTTLQTLA